MLIEHPHQGDPYDASGMWLMLDAALDYSGCAVWRRCVKADGPFDGPSSKMQISRILSAESDGLDELRKWAKSQIDKGADTVTISDTSRIVRLPARLSGKRENQFIELIKAKA